MSPSPEDNDNRISRLEGKMDDLFEALISLARAEEQIKTLYNQHKYLHGEEMKLEEEVEKLKESHDQLVATNKLLQKMIIAVGAIVIVEGMMIVPRVAETFGGF